MVTINDIDIEDGVYTSAEIDISEKFLTIQCDYTGIDGDFEIVPMISNETGGSAVFSPVYDFKGNPIRFKVEHRDVASGSKMFNIHPELLALSAKVVVRPIGGKYGATEGVVGLIIMNTVE